MGPSSLFLRCYSPGVRPERLRQLVSFSVMFPSLETMSLFQDQIVGQYTLLTAEVAGVSETAVLHVPDPEDKRVWQFEVTFPFYSGSDIGAAFSLYSSHGPVGNARGLWI